MNFFIFKKSNLTIFFQCENDIFNLNHEFHHRIEKVKYKKIHTLPQSYFLSKN